MFLIYPPLMTSLKLRYNGVFKNVGFKTYTAVVARIFRFKGHKFVSLDKTSFSLFLLTLCEFFAIASYFCSYLKFLAPTGRHSCLDFAIFDLTTRFFWPLARHFQFHLLIFAPKDHHCWVDLLNVMIGDRHICWDLLVFCASSLWFSLRPCDVCASNSSSSSRTSNFAPIASHFSLRLCGFLPLWLVSFAFTLGSLTLRCFC